MKKLDESKRIAIIFWEPYLGCAPSIINAARCLSEAGHYVDLYIRLGVGFVPPPEFNSNVSLIVVDPVANKTLEINLVELHGERGDSLVRQFARAFVPNFIRHPLGRWWDGSNEYSSETTPDTTGIFTAFSRLCADAIDQANDGIVIGVDTFGLCAAAEAVDQLQSRIMDRGSKQVELWYWSLEILGDDDSLDPHWPQLKKRERAAHLTSDLVIIQDQQRADYLAETNDVAGVPIVIVPNSPRGMTSRSVSEGSNEGLNPDRSKVLNDAFASNPNRRLVLHAGSVCDGMRSADLAMSTAEWPEPFDLVFHSHTFLSRHDTYADQLVILGKGRVHLSKTPVDYDKLDQLYAAVDLSIVIYDSSLGPNFQLLAGASGKLAHSLRCGVPVISVDNPSIAEVLHRHQCGIGVSRPEEVGKAIEAIVADLDRYRQNALKCFADDYEFDRHFEPLLNRARQLLTL